MTMTITELERSLRALRLSGMTATLDNRALQVAQQQMDFIEAFSALVQDELDRRRSRLIERRFKLSGLTERKDLKDFDWSYNPKNPRREILELANLKFIDEREDALFIGSPGVGKSHIAKALALLAVQRGYTVFYREAHVLVDDINQARELGELRKYRATIKAADLVVIDDLFLRKLPSHAGDELADVIMSRSIGRSANFGNALSRGCIDW
jgi:DNA replication protein DnaC